MNYSEDRYASLVCNVPPGAVHRNGTSSCIDDWNDEHPDDQITLEEWAEEQEYIERLLDGEYE